MDSIIPLLIVMNLSFSCLAHVDGMYPYADIGSLRKVDAGKGMCDSPIFP